MHTASKVHTVSKVRQHMHTASKVRQHMHTASKVRQHTHTASKATSPRGAKGCKPMRTGALQQAY